MVTRHIALFNAKGGCGKTTIAWNLAMGLSRRAPTLLLDADPQGSLQHWADWATEAEGFEIAVGEWPAGSGPDAQEDYAYWVTDCAPVLEDPRTRSVLASADLVLLPVLPSALDLWASQRSVEAMELLREARPGLEAYLLLNQIEGQSALSRASQKAAAAIGLPLLPVHIGRRAIYRSAAVEGRSVYQTGRRGIAAVDEIERLIEEILK